MSKNVIILNGSPRKNGNTKILCDAFKKGAEEAGHIVEYIRVVDQEIHGCLACGACKKNGGHCLQQDEMQAIYEKLHWADVIVLASPIYYYTWSGQMKIMLDRGYAVSHILQNKTFYLLAACAADDLIYTETMLDTFRKYHGCFRAGGNQEGGYVFGLGSMDAGEVNGTLAVEQAYEMGKAIKIAR